MTERLKIAYILVALSGLALIPTALRAGSTALVCAMIAIPLIICGELRLIKAKKIGPSLMEFHYFMLKVTSLILLGILVIARTATPTTWQETIALAGMSYGLAIIMIGIPFLE